MSTKNLFIVLKVLESMMGAWMLTSYTLFALGKGLTFTELNLLNTAFMTTNFFVDPWTGLVGDKYGHKRIFSLGMILTAIAFVIYGFAESFWTMLLAEVTAGIGQACASEAMEAWLENKVTSEEATEIISRASTWARLLGIISALLGSIIASQSLALPWFLGAVTVIPILVLLTRYRWEESLGDVKGIQLNYSPKEARQIWHNGYLRNAVLISVVVTFLAQPLNMFWNTRFVPDIGQAGLGILWAAMAIALAAGAWLSGKFPNVDMKIIGGAFLVISLGLVAASSSAAAIALIGFILHEAPRGFIFPALRTYTRSHTPDHLRAYFGSIRSALGMLAAAAGLLVFGPLADTFGIQATWQIACIAFAVAGLIFVLNKES